MPSRVVKSRSKGHQVIHHICRVRPAGKTSQALRQVTSLHGNCTGQGQPINIPHSLTFNLSTSNIQYSILARWPQSHCTHRVRCGAVQRLRRLRSASTVTLTSVCGRQMAAQCRSSLPSAQSSWPLHSSDHSRQRWLSQVNSLAAHSRYSAVAVSRVTTSSTAGRVTRQPR